MADEEDESDDTPIGLLPSGELAEPDDEDQELEDLEAALKEAEEEEEVNPEKET